MIFSNNSSAVAIRLLFTHLPFQVFFFPKCGEFYCQKIGQHELYMNENEK